MYIKLYIRFPCMYSECTYVYTKTIVNFYTEK